MCIRDRSTATLNQPRTLYKVTHWLLTLCCQIMYGIGLTEPLKHRLSFRVVADCKRGQSTASCHTVATNPQPVKFEKQIHSCQLVTNHLKSSMAFMQVVAAVDGRLVSIYDSVTQYKLGQTLHAKRGGAAWAPLHACYFAFPTMQQVHRIMWSNLFS